MRARRRKIHTAIAHTTIVAKLTMTRISLNDQWIDINQTRLSDAMVAWNYHTGKCAVAINGDFIPRSDYDRVTLQEGDQVDVVAPIGGG